MLKPNLVDYRWKKCRAALGLPEKMRFYDLRHFFATSVAYSGASEEELARVMGHSTSAFSHQVYVELFRERQESVNAELAAGTAALYESVDEHLRHSGGGALRQERQEVKHRSTQ